MADEGDEPGFHVGVLGTLSLHDPAGEPIVLTSTQRRLFAALLAARRNGAGTLELEDVLWDGAPPRTARQSLHNHVHRLRSRLAGARVLLEGDRYRLDPPPVSDAEVFEQLVARARRSLSAGSASEAVVQARRALGLWRGEPYSDLPHGFGVAELRSRLGRLRDEAENLLARALLASGDTATAVGLLEDLTSRRPEDEQLWELLIDALHRSGRRSEGLAAFRQARRELVDTLGVEPGRRLQELHRLLLHGAASAPELLPDLGPIGREPLLHDLIDRLGCGQKVLLCGEAGIGKSTLLRGVGERWASESIYVDCGSSPFAALEPIATLIERMAPRLRRLGLPMKLDEIVQRIPTGTFGGSPGTLVRRTCDVLVAGLAADPGTLLVLDNADGCGPTTRAILGEVLTRWDGPVLAAAQASEEGPGWENDHVVALAGLDIAGAMEVAERLLEAEVGEDFGRWLHDLTGGHPMLIVATLTDLIARGALNLREANPEPPSRTPVPVHVRDVLRERLRGLGRRTEQAVQLLAVLGEPIPSASLDGQLDALAPAVSEGLLVQRDGRIAFAHDLLRRVAYEDIPAGRRTELHHEAAQLDLAPASRAAHLLRAAALDPAAALAAAVAVARRALAEQAYGEGAEWLSRALAVGEGQLTPLERLRLEVDLADAHRLAGMEGHAEELLRAAEATLPTDDVDLRRRAVLAAVQLGGGVEVGPTQQRTAALAEHVLKSEGDPAWWARIAAASSIVHSMAGTPELCHSLFLEAWDRAPEDDEVLAGVLPYAYMALGHPDDLDRRALAAQRLTAAAERTNDPVAAFEAGHLTFSVALMRDDVPAAKVAHQAMTALSDRVADAGRRWSLAYQEAALSALDGRLDEAEEQAGRALAIGQGIAPRRAFAAYAGQVFELRRLQGRLAEVAPIVLHLVAEQPEVPGWAAAGALATAESDPARSRELFDVAAADDMAAVPRDFSWLAAAMSLGRAAVVLGDARRADLMHRILRPYSALACWQGTCSWGRVDEVLADLERVAG